MNEILRFTTFLLCVELGVFGGVIISEYALYLFGGKNTLFHENWKTIFQ